MQSLNRPLHDMPQIDGLRTFAVFAVIFSHYIPGTCRYFNFGHAGVQLFFTISGFLITGILLDCRSRIDDDGEGSIRHYLRQFYVRRFLRIFPLYYAVLLALALAHAMGTSLPYHLTYTSNLYMALTGQAVPAVHFWSLCVEEQFYLFWPLVVLLVRRTTLPSFMLCLIPLSIAFRMWCWMRGYHWETVYLLPSNLDCLATGSVLAIAYTSKATYHQAFRSTRLALIAGVAGLAVVLTLSVLYPGAEGLGRGSRFLFQNSIVALISAGLVWGAAFGYRGKMGVLLNMGAVRYLGRISYGIYVIHPLLPQMTRKLYATFGLSSSLVTVALNVAVTVVLASASWHLFEAPINSLKRFFPYQRSSLRQPAAASEITPLVKSSYR